MRTARRRLTLRQLAEALLLAALMLWASWGAADLLADHTLERTLKELRARGVATDLKELVPPPISEEENGAPYYEAACAALRALHLYGIYWIEDLADAEPEQRAAIHRDLEKIPEILELVRRARSFPKCRFERTVTQGEPLHLPELGMTHSLAQLVSYKAQEQAEDGRSSEAQESVRDLVALADAYRDEPSYSSQANRYLILDKAFSVVRWCSRWSSTENDLRGWLGVLPDPASLEASAQRAARGELAAVASLLTRRPILRAPCFRIRDSSFLDRLADPFLILTVTDGLFPLEQAVEICGLPYRDACRDGRWPTDLLRGRRTPQLLQGLIAPLDHLCERQAVAQAAIALARAGLQAEIRMMTWGAYPEEADGMDPFSGRPFLVDLEQGLIRSSGPRPMDLEALEEDNLVWRLTSR